METFFALLALCAGNSPVTGKQSWGWWFETSSRQLWRHSNVNMYTIYRIIYVFCDIYLFMLYEIKYDMKLKKKTVKIRMNFVRIDVKERPIVDL